MANVIDRHSIKINDDWDLNSLRTGSKAFHNYLKSAVAKAVGSKKSYSRSLLKKISVASGQCFMIRFQATKRSTSNLFINYVLTSPIDDELALSMQSAEYSTMDEVIADFDTIDQYIENIDTYVPGGDIPVSGKRATRRKKTS